MPVAMRLEGVTRGELEKLFVCRHQNNHQGNQNGQLVPIWGILQKLFIYCICSRMSLPVNKTR